MSKARAGVRSGGFAFAMAMAMAMAMIASLVVASVPITVADAATPTFTAVGSARQVYVTGVAASTQMSLVNPSGVVVQTRKANSLGGLLFRDVAPAAGYRVRRVADGVQSGTITVHSESAAPWDPGIYNQTIPSNGYTYLTTRDGTKLAVSVHPPTSPAGEPGLPPGIPIPSGPAFAPPYPTLIEYSGYGYANPAGPTNGIAVLANLMGFAVVDVNMRGTGCSGGAFDFFEPLQSLDGYDVIETVAHQPWVKNHKVGMMGISYGAISQLFTARLQPPSLAAIAPLSTIDATATTLYPGGILNNGFAVEWAKERQQEALPAGPNAGQPWAYQQIQSGDTTCAANQVLHGEAADLQAKIAANSHYDPAVADPLDPVSFVDQIKVPTFMACQWQDEQTGGHCPELVRHFTGTTQKWFTFTNGAHVDSIDPDTYNRWYDFLQLFVAHQAPIQNAAITRAAAPVIYQQAMGLPATDVVTLPADPIQLQPTYDLALAAFRQLPSVRVLFDNGAGPSPVGPANAGDPYAGFAQTFSSLPVAGTTARTWYLGSGGALTDKVPTRVGDQRVRCERARAAPYRLRGQHRLRRAVGQRVAVVVELAAAAGGHRGLVRLGTAHRRHHGRRERRGLALGALVDPRRRPAGHDQRGATRRQRGLRAERLAPASERKLSTDSKNMFKRPSTTLEPVPTFTAADASPMPAGQFVKVVVPLYYQGHAYRAGTRIRVTIAAPNGTQPIWAFDETVPSGTTAITFSSAMPSSLVLPVVPGVKVPTPQPPCGSLRNEPCRPYRAIVNTTAS